jgi:hypothetical protein
VLQAADLDDCFLGPDSLEEDDPDHFRCGRDGDHLMCPFQCDDCFLFYNIQHHRPGAKVQDKVLMMCIHRANLDAFWSREPATVHANRRERSLAGRNIRLWTHCLLEAYGKLGVYSGPVFRVGGKGGKVKRSAMGDLDPLFHRILTRVQE